MKYLPLQGVSKGELFTQMEKLRVNDAKWRLGRTFSLVYYAGEEISTLSKQAYNLYFHENGLNPMVFHSLKTFETEVLSMTSGLFHGDDQVVGSLTSGGSESILMAVKAYRDYAKVHHPEITEPEMIVPITVHAAFEKAAHYFGVKAIHAPVDENFTVDITAVENLITVNTILLVGSAPNYPQGTIDPIEALGELAVKYDLPLHVDACLGGFILPFIEKIGVTLPLFDFRVKGVTSISADIHKYGYAAKGVSALLYRHENFRRHQYFVYTDWPGGLFASPSATGTRPGGAIASAWAVLNYLGEEGYLRLTQKTMAITQTFMNGIRQISPLKILGQPQASVFSVASDDISIFALADQLEARNWQIDRQQLPDCIHFIITPVHEQSVDDFLSDLQQSVDYVKAHPESATQGNATVYGMVATITDKSKVDEFVLQTLNQTMRLD